MEIPYLSLKRITAQHADEIQKAVSEAVDSGWYLQGERIARFEREYANYCGAKHCVACANGLDALILLLQAHKELELLKDGDEVIVPANTYIATILAVTENNLVPILVEPRLDNFQIDDRLIEQAITKKTKAVMLVNLYGYEAFTATIGEICEKYGLLLFTDCAQSHGLTTRGKCAHSFYPGKNLGALADAGAVTTDDDKVAAVVRALGNYGSEQKDVFNYRGRNSRMDELTAAVLSVKLRYLDQDNQRRKDIAEYYLRNITNERLMLPPLGGVHHVCPVLCKERDRLQEYLKEHGIGTMVHYPIPPHKQKCYNEWQDLSFPITEQIHREELSIPLNQALTDEETEYIVNTINLWE